MQNRRPVVSSAPSAADISIGHDVVALISSAMYTEPLTVYRELVQNSADAVDEAISLGLLAPGQGRVDISVDALHRTIVVRDNGAGVPNSEFVRRMCSIGASRKRGTKARGFRGIGRLVGLGYCQELIFRSRSRSDARIYEAVWDCRILREALRSPAYSSLIDVISAVVRVSSRLAVPQDPDHFFEVELRKVVRIGNDGLVSAPQVDAYLGEVAPVPFHPKFSHGVAITEFLEQHVGISTIAVHINGAETPVTRPYRDVIKISPSKSARLQPPTFFEVPSQDGTIAAVGWITHHEYLGGFPADAGVRGLRARAGNLQIGDETCFEAVFPEPRFNQWTIGEVHVLDQRIVANARRDSFERNAHFEDLGNHLGEHGREVARRCRSLSTTRRRERSLKEFEDALDQYTDLLKHKKVARIMRQELIDDVLFHIERAQKMAKADTQAHLSRLQARVEDLMHVGRKGDNRRSKRHQGQADVLRLIRESIPNGVALSVTILKMLDDNDD